MKSIPNFLKLFDNLRKVLLADISDGIPCLFVFFRPYFGLESQIGYQPLPWSSQFSFWLLRCGFHLVQTIKLFRDIQVTILSLPFISLRFLTLWRPHFSCSHTETNIFYLWTFPPRTSSEWSNNDKWTVVLQLLGTSCWYCDNCITKFWAQGSYFLYLYMVLLQHYFHSEKN